MGADVKYHFEYGFSTLKSGKRGKHWTVIACTKVCPVVRCERCNRFGSPNWVRTWWYRPHCPLDGEGKEFYNEDREQTLCLGCLNQLRPLWKAQNHIIENARLIRRIKREVTRVNSENRRGTTGLSG